MVSRSNSNCRVLIKGNIVILEKGVTNGSMRGISTLAYVDKALTIDKLNVVLIIKDLKVLWG